MKSDQLKTLVNEKYSEIAKNDGSCCGSDCGCVESISGLSTEYQQLSGYDPESDLGLGCGIPTEFSRINEGDVVIDLGSGAGNDSFIARSQVGKYGKVIGIDFTEAMIEKAQKNSAKLGFKNVHFVKGDLERIPLADHQADVVLSNCVFNLVPDKQTAFNEMFRILKPSGHFSISDMALEGDLPEELKQSAELYAGCVSGAINIEEYLEMLKLAGFINIRVQKRTKIDIPSGTKLYSDNSQEILVKENQAAGIYSVTISGEKPETCCDSDCCNQ